MIIEKQYSGDESRVFWAMINTLDDKKGTLYTMGCRLQEMESEIYKIMEDRETSVKQIMREQKVVVK